MSLPSKSLSPVVFGAPTSKEQVSGSVFMGGLELCAAPATNLDQPQAGQFKEL